MKAGDTVLDAIEGKGCLGRSQPDEPVFVLVARDRAAAETVRGWSYMAEQMGLENTGRLKTAEVVEARRLKIAEARAVADAMDAWREAHGGGKLPD